MAILIVGGSGATGEKLVEQLLIKDQEVRVIVRSSEKLPEAWRQNSKVKIIHKSISELNETQMAEYLKGCTAVASCLGHTPNFKGIFGSPRKLVTDSVRLICNSIQKSDDSRKPIKFVLMNTAGNRNRDLNEPISAGEKLIMTLIRFFLPPQRDNEDAADYLRVEIGQKNKRIEWVVVRPDSLVNDEKNSEYDIHISPIRSAIFKPGRTSRINVAHFMTKLIIEQDLWDTWKGCMPVIYNRTPEK